MDRGGLTSQRKTAQMERNESGECCMAEKNHRVSEAWLKVNIYTKFDTTGIPQRILLMVLKENRRI